MCFVTFIFVIRGHAHDIVYSWSVQKYFELAHFTDKQDKNYINVKGIVTIEILSTWSATRTGLHSL